MADSTSQYLRVSSPSATAVKYTVSSRPNEPAKVVSAIRYVIRIVAVVCALLALIAKLEVHIFATGIHTLLSLTLFGGILQSIIDGLEWWILLITSFLTLYLCIRRDHTGQRCLPIVLKMS